MYDENTTALYLLYILSTAQFGEMAILTWGCDRAFAGERVSSVE